MKHATSADALDPRPEGRPVRFELSALAALFWLTLRQNVRGRKLLVLAVLYALPCGLAVLLRSLPRSAPPEALEFAFVFTLLPYALAPLTALLFASGMIQDEVEEQTLTYLLLRPLPRWALYLTRLLATLLTTVYLITTFTFVLYLCIWWGTPELTAEILPVRAPRVATLFALTQVAYCSLFGFMSLWTRRSLLAGVIYIVAIEGILANMEFLGRIVAVVYHFRVLALRWLNLPELIVREWDMDLEKAPDFRQGVQTLLIAGLVLAVLAAVRFAGQEFRMKTPEGT
jgi:ABC-2 type transport system permease protein